MFPSFRSPSFTTASFQHKTGDELASIRATCPKSCSSIDEIVITAANGALIPSVPRTADFGTNWFRKPMCEEVTKLILRYKTVHEQLHCVGYKGCCSHRCHNSHEALTPASRMTTDAPRSSIAAATWTTNLIASRQCMIDYDVRLVRRLAFRSNISKSSITDRSRLF